MKLSDIIGELEGAAQQEAAGIHVLETTRFEPELGAVAGSCLAAAKRRAEALGKAAEILRQQDIRETCERVKTQLTALRDGLLVLQELRR